MPGGHQRERGGVLNRNPAHGMSQSLEVALPSLAEIVVEVVPHALEQFGNDRLEQVLPATDAAVQRHRPHPKIMG